MITFYSSPTQAHCRQNFPCLFLGTQPPWWWHCRGRNM